MQLLRITQDSNYPRPPGMLPCAVIAMVMFSAIGVLPRVESHSWIPLVISASLAIGLLRAWAEIRVPFERELLIDQESIRFGHTDLPGHHHTILRSKLRSVTFKQTRERTTLTVDTGFFGTRELAPDVLRTPEEMSDVLRIIREHWPEVIIREKPLKASR